MCLTRLPEGVNSTIPRNALRKNASGVAMRMKIRYSKTPQLFAGLVDFCCILTRLLYPRVGDAVQMDPTNFQQKSVRVVHAHFVPRCMKIRCLPTDLLQHAVTPKLVWLPGYTLILCLIAKATTLSPTSLLSPTPYFPMVSSFPLYDKVIC